MAEDKIKVYEPETIPDQPFPQEELASYDISQLTTGGIYSPQSIKDQPLPRKIIAHETIGSALNTKSRKILAEFQFTESGALQIGKYTNGISGDLRITPNGITARDQSGLTTFAIDGTTGNAVFKGEVQTGSIVTGDLFVGNNRVIIDGENKRILILDENGVARVLIGYLENGF